MRRELTSQSCNTWCDTWLPISKTSRAQRPLIHRGSGSGEINLKTQMLKLGHMSMGRLEGTKRGGIEVVKIDVYRQAVLGKKHSRRGGK